MRLAGLIIAVSLACSLPAANARELGREASQELASRVFWTFATCAVARRPEASIQLLDTFTFDRAGLDAADAFAQKNARCLGAGEELTMDQSLFIGALAGAYFTRKYKGRPLPDYSATPPLIDPGELKREVDPSKIRHAFLLTFGECVFRTKTEDVLGLLETRPASDEEDAIFTTLTPMLGHCLPVEEGSQVMFSRVNLRSLLGEAAYKVDSKLPASSVEALEVKN